MKPPICDYSENHLAIRGIPIQELILEYGGFVRTLLLTLTGEQPDPADLRIQMIESLFVAWVDHGEVPPSTANCLNAASVGVGMPHAIASAFLCFGFTHAPIEMAAHHLQGMMDRENQPEMQAQLVRSWKRVPGFGHPIHKHDPRLGPLMRLAVTACNSHKHIQAAKTTETILLGMGKEVGVNLAGVTAAIWLDMGLPIEGVAIIPIIGRSVGLAAHFVEQKTKPAFRGIPPK